MSQQISVYREINLKDGASVRGLQTIAKTASYTVTLADSGKLLVANHATVAVAFTLPAVATAKGCVWHFANKGAAAMSVVAPTAIIIGKNSATVTTVAFSTTSEIIGAACSIRGDGTNYYLFVETNCAVTLT